MVDPTISQGARRLVRLVVVNLAFGLLFWLLCSALGRATRAQATLLPSPRIRWSRLLERAAVAATACAMAAGLLLVADQLLDRMPHVQDSVCYLFQANVFVSGRLHAVLPADPDAFAHEFLAPHAGLWTSVFPPGQSLLLALGVVLGIPWAVGPLASALAVLPVFFAVRSLFDARTAALTIALFATSPAVLSLGATMMSHAACLFACSLAFYFAVTLSERVGRDAPARTISFCLGAALGFAALTRPLTAAAWSVPVAFWILIAFARARRNPIPAIVLAVAGGAPFLGFFAIHNHSFSGDVWTTPLDVYLRLFGQDFFELISRRHAFELAWSFRNTLTNLHAFLSMQIGLPIILTGGFAAIPFLSGRAKFADALLAAAALSLPVAYFFYWADGAMYGARYWFEMTPAFLALSARGILLSLDAAGGGARRLIPLLFLAVCASGHLAGVGVGVLSGLRGYNSMSRAASDSVTNRIEKPALVFVDSEPRHEWWLYGRLFWQNAPTLDGPVVYARLRGDERDRVLAERYSGRTFYLLRQDLSLTPWVPGVRPTRPPGRAPGSSFPPPTPVPTGPRPPEAT